MIHNSNSKISYKHSLRQKQDLIFPIQVVTDPEKIKKYHRTKLYNLSLKTLGQIPQLDELTYDQDEWVKRRMKGSAKSWETWDL